jgi:hypothetical protein
MNERIRELATEVGISVDYLTNTKQIVLIEKFAELIVRECISVVDDAERGGSNEIWDNAVKFIRKDIKEHFGVER